MANISQKYQGPRQISGLKLILIFFAVLAAVFFANKAIFGNAFALTTIMTIVFPLALFILFAIWFFRRLGVGNPQSGLGVQILPWDVVWSARPGQAISVGQMYPQLGALTDENQVLLAAKVQSVSIGSAGGVEYHAIQFIMDSGDRGLASGIVQAAFRLPHPIPGTILCHRIDFGFRVGQNEVQLESVEFNRGVQMSAQPKNLPWQVFPPDFMDWYLQSKSAPSFFLNHDRGTLLFLFQGKNISVLKPVIEQIIAKIASSGALEKAEPLPQSGQN